jgi:hypothetical protein
MICEMLRNRNREFTLTPVSFFPLPDAKNSLAESTLHSKTHFWATRERFNHRGNQLPQYALHSMKR